MNVLKAGAYATAVLAIVALLSNAYQVNAWASDLAELNNKQQTYIFQMENRMLSRELLQWNTKPAVTSVEKEYKSAIIEQLKSDKSDIIMKLRSLNEFKN